MHIRRAVAVECEELSTLARRAKAHWGYADAQLEAWRTRLAISPEALAERPTFVGEIGGTIVGFYSLVPSAGPWELDNLWVAPEHMRQGVGRALVRHAWEASAAGGASCLLIDADPNAESFYIACGATRIGEVAAPIVGEAGRVRPQLMLTKPR